MTIEPTGYPRQLQTDEAIREIAGLSTSARKYFEYLPYASEDDMVAGNQTVRERFSAMPFDSEEERTRALDEFMADKKGNAQEEFIKQRWIGARAVGMQSSHDATRALQKIDMALHSVESFEIGRYFPLPHFCPADKAERSDDQIRKEMEWRAIDLDDTNTWPYHWQVEAKFRRQIGSLATDHFGKPVVLQHITPLTTPEYPSGQNFEHKSEKGLVIITNSLDVYEKPDEEMVLREFGEQALETQLRFVGMPFGSRYVVQRRND
jgi:hypothetical protein